MSRPNRAVEQENAQRIALIIQEHPEWTQRQIGEELGLQGSTVSSYISKFDLPYVSHVLKRRKKSMPWAMEIVRINALAREQGLSYGQYVAMLEN